MSGSERSQGRDLDQDKMCQILNELIKMCILKNIVVKILNDKENRS